MLNIEYLVLSLTHCIQSCFYLKLQFARRIYGIVYEITCTHQLWQCFIIRISISVSQSVTLHQCTMTPKWIQKTWNKVWVNEQQLSALHFQSTRFTSDCNNAQNRIFLPKYSFFRKRKKRQRTTLDRKVNNIETQFVHKFNQNESLSRWLDFSMWRRIANEHDI